MKATGKAQELSDGFHDIEAKARELAIAIAEQKALAHEIAGKAGLSAFETRRVMDQLTAADQSCNDVTNRIGLSHVAAERVGEKIRAGFPWDCPEASAEQPTHLKMVS